MPQRTNTALQSAIEHIEAAFKPEIREALARVLHMTRCRILIQDGFRTAEQLKVTQADVMQLIDDINFLNKTRDGLNARFCTEIHSQREHEKQTLSYWLSVVDKLPSAA